MVDWETVQPDVIKLLQKHYTPGRTRSVDRIILHHNAGNLTVEGCWSVWQTREASAHYQVEESGRIGQLVYDRDTAWHCPGQNSRAIGIEHANSGFGPWTISDACLENGAHLTAALCRAHGLGRPEWGVNVFGHNDFAATTCPGEIGTGGSQHARYMERAQWWYDDMEGLHEPVKPPLPEALSGYTDLDSEAWYVGPLEKAVKAGYINGYPDGRMAPDEPVTRGQAVCLVANADGAEFEHPFSDVIASPYYYDAIAWAKGEGIVSGSAGEFRPEDPCTREEFAAILCNWVRGENVGEPAGYTDWAEVSDWAKPAMAWAVEMGIVSGNAGRLRPHDACTRAEAAAMLVNMLQ